MQVRLAPHLSRAIEGVECHVDTGDGRVKALITREVLEGVFEAEETPEGWLRAYNLHTTTIQQAILDLYRAKPPPCGHTVILSEREWNDIRAR